MDFNWIGPKVNCYYDQLEHGNYDFYKSFHYRGEEFNVGEFVMVVKSKTKGRIGMLMCLYHSHETRHRSDPFRGIVTWFTKAKDLNVKFNPTKIKFDINNEVIENNTETDVVISLENIVRKCKIVYGSIEDPVYLIRSNKLDVKIYFSCRYKVESERIVPIFSSNTENYIVDGRLTILPNFESLEVVSSPNQPQFECVFLPPVDVTPTKQLSEIQNLNINSSRSTRKASVTSLDFCSSDEEREKDAVRSSRNRSKFVKLAVRSENSKGKQKLSLKRNSSVRRVLNDSFESPTLSLDKTPNLTYSIVNSNVETENGLKMTLKLNENSKPNVAVEHPVKLDDSEVNQKNVNVANIQEIDNKIECTPSTKVAESGGARRSVRIVNRKSYAEFTSPQFETPKKRSCKTNTYTSPLKSKIPVPRTSQNSLKTTVIIEEEPKVAPKGSQSAKKGRNPSTVKTPKTSDSCLREKLLKSSTKQLVFEESDEEDVMPKRGKSVGASKKSPRNTPSARAKMVRDGVITPSVQSRDRNVANDGTPLQKARTQLHVSHVPTALPCREKEFSDIISFLEGKLLDGCGGCMYISGVPGTGKTATVTEVIRSLEESAKENHIPAFKYVNINGMKLSEPRQSYVEIMKQLTGKTLAWEQAQTALENKFVKSKSKSVPVILVVDELDILCTKRQDVVYNLLDWPSKGKTQLMVITIANTMDLPERLLMGRVTSRLGLTRLTFQAYTHKQLQEIVSKRLSGTDAFNEDSIQLVARKVASVSGDARRALDICRRSAEIAELEGDRTMVTMSHVNQALSAMITQPKVQAIKQCSKLEKLILQAAVAETDRTGVEETSFDCILTMLVSLAAMEGFKLVSNTILQRTVAKLGASRLLLIDQNCNDLYQRIILNVSSDDVYYAMQSDF